MQWSRAETHHVSPYVFCWFTDGAGAWIVGVWNESRAPDGPDIADLDEALTAHHISLEENPRGDRKSARVFCERFMSDIPFRVRAIRNKISTLRSIPATVWSSDTGGDV